MDRLTSLRVFREVVEAGSFSRAAEELNVTPAAVSRMIARLEDHLETTLFLRQPGGTQHAGLACAGAWRSGGLERCTGAWAA